MKVVPKRKWRYPLALEREYSKYLVKFVEQNMEIVKQFLPEMEELLLVYGVHADSAATELEILLDRIHANMKAPEQMEATVKAMAIRVDRYNRQEWDEITKSVLGMPMSGAPVRKVHHDAEADENLRELWVSENLDLIKSVDQQTMERIKRSLQEKIVGNVNRRELVKDLAEDVERITGLERNRAILIARDQVGKLNGRLMQYRQTHAGITEYKWSTSGDRRVRASHVALNGKTFTWGPEHPAPEGPPGTPIRCRCVALPVIDLDKVVTRPVPGSYTQVEKANIGGEPQEYRPVTISDKVEKIVRNEKEIAIRKVTSTVNPIYKSENVQLKPKSAQFIDRQITKALKILKPKVTDVFPKVIVITKSEMETGALASYIAGTNTLLMISDVGDKKKLLGLQEGLVCSDDPLSTYMHELLHWQDAMRYIEKFGAIDSKFFPYLRGICKRRLDLLGYVVYNNISPYASKMYRHGLYEEPDVEYRTMLYLGGAAHDSNPATRAKGDGS